MPKPNISSRFVRLSVMYKLIGYKTALEYWNTVGARFLRDASMRRKATRKARAALRSTESPSLDGSTVRPGGCVLPLFVLVGTQEARTRTDCILSRSWLTDLPEGAFADAGLEFLISTPEFCFLQMARDLSLAQLIMLGYELCGSYAMVEGTAWDGAGAEGKAVMRKRSPLTSVEKLRSFVAKADGAYGRKKALRAVKYILDGSASPRETALAMLLCLPYGLGGFGLPAPKLNYRIDIGKRAAPMADREYCVCDLYWPQQKIAVEYDSDLHHTGSFRIASDTKRRNTLAARNVTVIGVTRVQIDDVIQLRKTAKTLAKLMGKRLRCDSPKLVEKHYALRAELGIALAVDG